MCGEVVGRCEEGGGNRVGKSIKVRRVGWGGGVSKDMAVSMRWASGKEGF